MRGLVLIVAALGFTICARASEPAVCPQPGPITAYGTVRSLQSMREEPQALMETFMVVGLPFPLCGKEQVTVHVIGVPACTEGDALKVTGDFSPPSRLTGIARISAEIHNVTCTPPKR